MKKILVFALLIITISCNQQKKEPVVTANYQTFKNEITGKDVQLVDVRTATEYQSGFIKDAINMDVLDTENFKKQIEALDKSKPVYIYCRSGNRSNKASKIFIEKGFTNIVDFSGGYLNWKKNQ
jgi:rhodanese-related sulfurtransferase